MNIKMRIKRIRGMNNFKKLDLTMGIRSEMEKSNCRPI